MIRRLVLAAFVLAAPVLPGCGGSKSSISGKVTYEGAPIGRGQITFAPAGGRGKVCSVPIEAGAYSIENVPPGGKIVQIIGVKQIHFAKTHAEMAEAANADPDAVPESADEVPANAQGNNQAVETTLGVQALNFDLKKPRLAP
ncbi:MAG: hypothetical protein ABSG53_03465 [Thermoguttaceae bacterium]|jgi:hypothetical protein